MKKQENKRGEAGERPWLRATLAALRGGLLACGAAVLLLLAAACLISTGAVGSGGWPGSPGACVAGSLVGGLYAVGRRAAGHWPWAWGRGSPCFCCCCAWDCWPMTPPGWSGTGPGPCAPACAAEGWPGCWLCPERKNAEDD